MTKTEIAIARIEGIDAANRAIALQKGRIARFNNRPKTGVLVPKYEDDAELDAWTNGWEAADAELTKAE